MGEVTFQLLATAADLVPTLRSWFESEWPEHYGDGGPGDARKDLLSYANVGTLPLGLVAFHDGKPCGFAALKVEPFASHPHLGPWVGAAYVLPALRRRGIGRSLFAALEAQAAGLGCARIYCATATSASLLRRCGWTLLETVSREGTTVGVYVKAV